MNIGLLVMIIWVVLSFLGSSKKQKRGRKKGGTPPLRKPSGISQLLRDLGKQFEESARGEKPTPMEMPAFSMEDVEDMPLSKPSPVQTVPVQPKSMASDRKTPGKSPSHHTDINLTRDAHYYEEPSETVASGLIYDLQSAGSLQKAILFKEILGSPRALRPYHPSITRD
ncbi:MAG: hypothetical protein GXO91_02745 [FCB group bacterium]|nr:hypothetical protein [FCB group bacterium]